MLLQCRVPGCTASYPQTTKRPVRICPEHRAADVVKMEGGVPGRFCQQCSRLHPLDRFDGNRRTCLKRLDERKRLRRECSDKSKRNVTPRSALNGETTSMPASPLSCLGLSGSGTPSPQNGRPMLPADIWESGTAVPFESQQLSLGKKVALSPGACQQDNHQGINGAQVPDSSLVVPIFQRKRNPKTMLVEALTSEDRSTYQKVSRVQTQAAEADVQVDMPLEGPHVDCLHSVDAPPSVIALLCGDIF